MAASDTSEAEPSKTIGPWVVQVGAAIFGVSRQRVAQLLKV